VLSPYTAVARTMLPTPVDLTATAGANSRSTGAVPMDTLLQVAGSSRDVPALHSNSDVVPMAHPWRRDPTRKDVVASTPSSDAALIIGHLRKVQKGTVVGAKAPSLDAVLMELRPRVGMTSRDVRRFPLNLEVSLLLTNLEVYNCEFNQFHRKFEFEMCRRVWAGEGTRFMS